MGLLENIKTSSDLKKLEVNELPVLCEEIRERILSVVSNNGGHLSSNLGSVEATVAIHYVFDLPTDKLIFDVGHQCYTHKILSGRNEEFDTIRKDEGLSGFPDREESEFDPFTTGHAGSSISAGLGYCIARDTLGEDYRVINFVGDGSIVNGLNLEALTSSSVKPKNFIVILNDNGMSISKNSNAFYKFISKKTVGNGYIKSKKALKKAFGEGCFTKFLSGFRNVVKRMFFRNNYFEQFGFKYVAGVDGNDVREMVEILQKIKKASQYKAVFLHVNTQKGKGYQSAEEHSDTYHGVGKNLCCDCTGFSSAFGEKLISLMGSDKRIVAITAGMQDGTGVKKAAQSYPTRFIDVGIAEEYAVTLAGGMASGGLRPIVAIYSTFLQRAYDQVLEDVCLQNLPVIFCLDRAGLVGADGKTHQGLFDLSYLSHMPNMTILCPSTIEELSDAIDYAISLNSPVAIRYPKNCKLNIKTPKFSESLWNEIKEGDDLTVLAVGPAMTSIALDFANKCDKSVRVVSARTVKPLDQNILEKIKNTPIITMEENVLCGGFGWAVENYYAKVGAQVKVCSLGVDDKFIKNGSCDKQYSDNGLDVDNLLKIAECITNNTEDR